MSHRNPDGSRLWTGLDPASEEPTEAVLGRIVERARETTGGEAVLISLTPDGAIREVIGCGGAEADDARAALPSGPASGIVSDAKTRGTVVTLDRGPLSADDAAFLASSGDRDRSAVAVPVHTSSGVRAVLLVARVPGTGPFDDDAVGMMVFLAREAAIALEHARLLYEARVRAEALAAVNELTQAILAGEHADQVLHLVARRARELLGARVATVVTAGSDDGTLLVRVADGPGADRLPGSTFAAGPSITGRVMASREPVVVADVSAHVGTNQPIAQLEGLGPALFMPLAVGAAVFGTLSLANPRGGRPFTDADIALVRTFAGEAAVALQYARAREDLDRLALMEERDRIAMDLHDGVVQTLFAVGLSLQASESTAESVDEMRSAVGGAVVSIDTAIRDLRNYIYALDDREALGRQLEQSLLDLVEAFRLSRRVGLDVFIDPVAASALASRGSEVVQLARESLSNAVRHSGASTVTLELRSSADGAVVEVRDDGRGFDPSTIDTPGLGLASLRTRSEAIGATFELVTAAGSGTVVRVTVPV